MCTTIARIGDGLLFGRNMDIEYSFGERIIAVPRCFPIKMRRIESQDKHYAFIGIGTLAGSSVLMADGINECGLAGAGLNFPAYAYYGRDEAKDKTNIAPFEVIPYILSTCKTVKEAADSLNVCSIVDIDFSDDVKNAPLHWHFADKAGSITVESTCDGLKVYENGVNVLTNSPSFDKHLEKYKDFENLQNVSGDILGDAGLSLPGDFTPSSRFIRAAYLLKNARFTGDASRDVSIVLDVLASVAMPYGVVIDKHMRIHETTYTAVMDGEECSYSVRTKTADPLFKVKLYDIDIDGDGVWSFPLSCK